MRIFHNTLIIALVVCSACGNKDSKESISTAYNVIKSLPDDSSYQKEEPSQQHPADTLSKVEETKKTIDITPKEESKPPEPVDENNEVPVSKELDENIDTKEVATQNVKNLPDHAVWNGLMKQYVTSDGKVNYKQLKSHQTTIKDYISKLSGVADLSKLSKGVRLAFWINLYNAITVNLILENYPLKSVMDINGGKAWDLKLVTVGERSLSLNDIEHNIIRKQFKEPRIHFAVNCAAKSCPKLLNAAFSPERLERQLETQTNYFVHNKLKNNITPDKLALSKIFDWYSADFGDAKKFIQKYEPTIDMSLEVGFAEYDWALNQ